MERLLHIVLIWATSLVFINFVFTAKYNGSAFFITDAIFTSFIRRFGAETKRNKNLSLLKSLDKVEDNKGIYYDSNESIENDYEKARQILHRQLEKMKKENAKYVESINTFSGFLDKYIKEVKHNKSCSAQHVVDLFTLFNCAFLKYKDFSFPNFHPYDKEFYKWSMDFWIPLIDKKKSKFLGIENIEKIVKWKNKGHNIFILGNHHIETDANLIKYFFKANGYEDIAKDIIFIGGHKIRADPLSRPFTASTNILCVYSKKYIENPAHLKEEKIAFNMKSINILQNLLKEGHKVIWFTPSGGRDRRDSDGTIHISPFDPKIIRSFYLFSQKSKVKTHFVGLALHTYYLCQPPDTIDIDEIEKERTCSFTPIYINLGEDIIDFYPNIKEEQICSTMSEYVNKLYKEIDQYK